MSARRILALMGREYAHGSRELMFIMAVVIPLLFSLVIALLVGTLAAGLPRLGVLDLGAAAGERSALPARLAARESIEFCSYADEQALRGDVQRGALDMGLVLASGADATLLQGQETAMQVLVWGESLLKHRTALSALVAGEVMDLVGLESPVRIETVLLGNEPPLPWGTRLFPMLVMSAILLGGTMVPAAALVQEKQARTLRALTTTPMTFAEVLVAKGAVGASLSLIMGVIILIGNGALGSQPGLTLGLIALGSLLSAELGLILGVLVGDISTLFTVIKGLGILLYAPALVYLFPSIPAWIGRLFPTYYMLAPILDTSLHGAGWGDIAGDVAILAAVTVLAGVVVALLARRDPA